MLAALGPLALRLGAFLLRFAERGSSDAIEKLRIERGVDIEKVRAEVAIAGEARQAVTAGMQHKAFWLPWLLAAVPLSAWFAWGILDSLTNGLLPDVATLPPQLKEYADIVWGNIFYVGGGVAGAGIVARAIAARR